MGKSRLLPYVIEYADIRLPNGMVSHMTPTEWRITRYGKPTPENIEKHVRKFIDSQKPGEINNHLAVEYGMILVPNAAWVYRQHGKGRRELVGSWKAPMFMAINPRRSSPRMRRFGGKIYVWEGRWGAYGSGNREQSKKDAESLASGIREEYPDVLARTTIDREDYGWYRNLWIHYPNRVFSSNPLEGVIETERESVHALPNPHGEYKMFGVKLTEFGSIEYKYIRRGKSVWSVIHPPTLKNLAKQGISKDDILSGRVVRFDAPRLDPYSPFAQFRFYGFRKIENPLQGENFFSGQQKKVLSAVMQDAWTELKGEPKQGRRMRFNPLTPRFDYTGLSDRLLSGTTRRIKEYGIRELETGYGKAVNESYPTHKVFLKLNNGEHWLFKFAKESEASRFAGYVDSLTH